MSDEKDTTTITTTIATSSSSNTNNTQHDAVKEEDSSPSNQPNHPVPPPFNPMTSSHATSTSAVHSVVPDLMRVYESLTKTNPHDGGHGGQEHHHHHQQPPQQQQQDYQHSHQPQGQQQQQDMQYFQQYQPPPPQLQLQLQMPPIEQQMLVQAPATHVDYSFITSEEQYRQLYQNQSARDPNQVSQYQGQIPSSLPYIPAPFEKSSPSPSQPAEAQPEQQTADADKASNSEDSSSRPSSRASLRRKRSSPGQEKPEPEPPSSSSSTGGGKTKGRKKAKETDGRWSKRFTWPEELHRDFVSAVFDVGLKHSSPSTILEHMPKHQQITSERIKSHLQKYRVHRIKSKQEFMSSYESTMKKFRNGEVDGAITLSNGEVAAHLSHAALTDVTDPSNIADDSKSSNNAAATEAQAAATEQQDTQQPQQAHSSVPPPSSFRGAAPPPGHEALMLPKLTEAEKMSPIGASMGYLLGLFFSLKKQLLMQRAMNASSTNPTSEPNKPPGIPLDPSVANGPVTAVYNSFVGSGPGAMHPPPLSINAMAPPPILATGSIDWSASSNSVGAPLAAAAAAACGGKDPAQPVANPVVVQTGSTRTNLEASSMMKREMQNQMAFQNKMRALKQQELNKCKTVIPTSANNNHAGNDHSNGGQNDHHQHPQQQQQQQQQHHHHQQQQRHEDSASSYTFDEHNANSKNSPATTPPPLGSPGISHHQQTAQTPHHSSDQDGGGGDGDANVQGAGESARARVPSFSMGGSEDFWNADVMDEQLFEFLMNN